MIEQLSYRDAYIFERGTSAMNDRIIESAENMDLSENMRLLKMTYWADQRSVEQVSKSVANSSCYGEDELATDLLTCSTER